MRLPALDMLTGAAGTKTDKDDALDVPVLIAVAEEAEDLVIEASTSTVVVDAKLDAAAELSGAMELVKNFQTVGDPGWFWLCASRVLRRQCFLQRQIRRFSGGFQLAERGTYNEKRGRLDHSWRNASR